MSDPVNGRTQLVRQISHAMTIIGQPVLVALILWLASYFQSAITTINTLNNQIDLKFQVRDQKLNDISDRLTEIETRLDGVGIKPPP